MCFQTVNITEGDDNQIHNREKRASNNNNLQRFLSSSLYFLVLSADAAASQGFYLYLAHLAASVQLLQAHTLVLLVSFSSMVLLIDYHFHELD